MAIPVQRLCGRSYYCPLHVDSVLPVNPQLAIYGLDVVIVCIRCIDCLVHDMEVGVLSLISRACFTPPEAFAHPPPSASVCHLDGYLREPLGSL